MASTHWTARFSTAAVPPVDDRDGHGFHCGEAPGMTLVEPVGKLGWFQRQ